MTNAHIGVMLMTYGSPATLEDIPTYLKNIRGGRQPDDELIQISTTLHAHWWFTVGAHYARTGSRNSG